MARSGQTRNSFTDTVVPLLDQYCYGCHGHGKRKGDLALDEWKEVEKAVADRKTWEKVLQMVQSHEMPPRNKAQPSSQERERLAKWIETEVFQCDCDHPDPGRVTIRRLNRAEYNNTIRDLLGVDFKPAADFPVDDSGYGFDNIGDALSLPPVLAEKYFAAAQQVLDIAFPDLAPAKTEKKTLPVDQLDVGYNARQHGNGWVALNSTEEDDVAVDYPVRHPGRYAVRVKAYARQDSTNAIVLTFMLDKTPVKIVTVETNQAAPQLYEALFDVPRGKQRFRAVVRRVKDGLSEEEALMWKSGPQQKGGVFVEHLDVEGPLDTAPASPLKLPGQIVITRPARGRETATARDVIRAFATRAYRRPVAPPELDRLLGFVQAAWKRGENFESGLRLGFHAILVSPHFLYRGELQPEPDNPKAVHTMNEYALASRLSYFLWSTMPDEELFACAKRGTLRRNLDQQVRRMLKDPKARALTDNFAGQWLQTRNLDLLTPDPEKFPAFDEALRLAMKRETELFFDTILREDRSVLEFLTADYTFVNPRLGRHYGITNLASSQFQRISLKGTPRRGVLTHASVLALTSNPTRTSPVKRGKWVLENLLNAPPPPPPPDVPELKEEKVLSGSLRQRMEQHRENPACAGCHARMDPIGFAFEHFDGIGAWRDKEGDFPVDSAGELPTGESFQGAFELTELLARARQKEFVRCLADKLLTYALGRGLEFYDKCALDQITKRLEENQFKFSSLILEIVKSTPFQMRRGDPGT